MNFPPPTEKQARLIWMALTGLAVAALVTMVGAVLWGLGKVVQVLSPVLWPVAVAAILAFLLNPLVDFFQKKGRTRTQSILIVFGLGLLIVSGVCSVVVPQLIKETRQFVERVPSIVQNLEDRLNDLANNPPPLLRKFLKRGTDGGGPPAISTNAPPVVEGGDATNATFTGNTTYPTNVTTAITTVLAGTNGPSLLVGAIDEKTLQSARSWLAEELPGISGWIFGTLGTWFGILVSLVLVPVYAFYILVEKYELEKNWTDYLPVSDSKFKTELVFVLRALKNYLAAFFRGQILVAFCEGILYTIGFLAIQLPYGLLLGASAAILTIVPFLGATVLCIVSFVVAVVQTAGWKQPAEVLAVVVIVQSLEVFWISPWIMKGRVGLHPAIIIFAVMAGTMLLGGLLGGILAIPLAAMVKVMMSRYVWKRREG
jgi:predicted PurR-regulated permease PerM